MGRGPLQRAVHYDLCFHDGDHRPAVQRSALVRHPAAVRRIAVRAPLLPEGVSQLDDASSPPLAGSVPLLHDAVQQQRLAMEQRPRRRPLLQLVFHVHVHAGGGRCQDGAGDQNVELDCCCRLVHVSGVLAHVLDHLLLPGSALQYQFDADQSLSHDDYVARFLVWIVPCARLHHHGRLNFEDVERFNQAVTYRPLPKVPKTKQGSSRRRRRRREIWRVCVCVNVSTHYFLININICFKINVSQTIITIIDAIDQHKITIKKKQKHMVRKFITNICKTLKFDTAHKTCTRNFLARTIYHNQKMLIGTS